MWTWCLSPNISLHSTHASPVMTWDDAKSTWGDKVRSMTRLWAGIRLLLSLRRMREPRWRHHVFCHRCNGASTFTEHSLTTLCSPTLCSLRRHRRTHSDFAFPRFHRRFISTSEYNFFLSILGQEVLHFHLRKHFTGSCWHIQVASITTLELWGHY